MTKAEKTCILLTAIFLAILLYTSYAGEKEGLRTDPVLPLPSATEEVVTSNGDALWVVLEDRIDLNSATAEELARLPGIGEVLAARIVAYREEHGPFETLEDLLCVDGVGTSVLDKIYAAMGEK